MYEILKHETKNLNDMFLTLRNCDMKMDFKTEISKCPYNFFLLVFFDYYTKINKGNGFLANQIQRWHNIDGSVLAVLRGLLNKNMPIIPKAQASNVKLSQFLCHFLFISIPIVTDGNQVIDIILRSFL